MLGFILHFIKIMPISHDLIYSAIDSLALLAAGSQIATGGVGGLFKGIGGLAAAALGKKAKEEPQYEIPKEVFEATRRAEEMAQTGMPEASRMMALQGAQQSAVQAGRRAEMAGRGALLGNIGNIQAGLDRTNLSIAAQDAATRLQNQRFAQQALMTQAQYRDKAFANRWQSWMNKFQQERAQQGAITQNIARNIDTATSAAFMALGGGFGGIGADNTTTTSNIPRVPVTPPGSINALSGVINAPQLPSNMGNTGGSFLWSNTPSASQLSFTNRLARDRYAANYNEAMQDLFSQPIGQ